MIELAKHPRDEFVPLKEVAAAQNISEKYLEAIVRRLVGAGILEGQRGRGGGYRLSGQPESCSAGTILSIMEGRMVPVACLREGAPPCERSDTCETLPLWKQFYEVVEEFFGSVTIADLAYGRNDAKSQWVSSALLNAGFEDGAGI